MSPRWAPLFDALIAEHPRGAELDLDALAERTAPLGLSYDEIGALLDALEGEGRAVGSSARADVTGELRVVLAAARALASEHGRTPRLGELVERTGLDVVIVRRALQLGRVVGR